MEGQEGGRERGKKKPYPPWAEERERERQSRAEWQNRAQRTKGKKRSPRPPRPSSHARLNRNSSGAP